jgi:hydrogenase/urease accessory protein HupE
MTSVFQNNYPYYKNTLILVFFNINVFLLPVISSAHSEWPSKTSLYSEYRGTFRVEIETNLEDLLINIKQKYADDNELIFSENYEKLRNLDSNRLKKILLSVSDKFLNSIDIRFDRKSAKLSIRSINIIDNLNIKEARKSILILEVKAPSNAMSIEWSWDESFGNNVIRTMDIDGKAFRSVWFRKSPSSPPLNLAGMPGKNFASRFLAYLEIGFSHIITKGFDHIIFVLGIFLLSTNWKIMLAQVTCFTIAHTITLVLSIFGLLALPDRVIEPLIALSIVYVGIENIVTEELKKWRPILVFLFGLLHGLGFAGVLINIGIPEGYFLESLVAFNLGIEAGQILVVGLAYFILFRFFNKKSAYRKYVVIPGSITISTIGSWMLYDRIIF